MEKQDLTPQESIQLISSVIQEARSKFVENGFIYLFWGILIFVVGMLQFLLIQIEMRNISYYPYFILPFGFFFSAYYFRTDKKKNSRKNRISSLINYLWIILGINMMILGFGFPMILKANLIPIFLILSGIGISISGCVIEDRPLIIAGIFSNIVGFFCFFATPDLQPLIFALTALCSNILPGLWLRKKYKYQHEI